MKSTKSKTATVPTLSVRTGVLGLPSREMKARYPDQAPEVLDACTLIAQIIANHYDDLRPLIVKVPEQLKQQKEERP